MTTDRIFYLLLVLTAIGVAFGIYSFLRRSLRGVLQSLVQIDGVSTFYERALLICLLLACVGTALGSFFTREEELTLMDLVWGYADDLGEVLSNAVWFPLSFAVLLAVLIAALGRRRDG